MLLPSLSVPNSPSKPLADARPTTARSAPVSRAPSTADLPPNVPKLNLLRRPSKDAAARLRPLSARTTTRPALTVSSPRTLEHLTQPATLSRAFQLRSLTPRESSSTALSTDGGTATSKLLAATRALPEQTHADKLLERLADELGALKENPAELQAMRARLAPRQPLTIALQEKLKAKDARIAELEALVAGAGALPRQIAVEGAAAVDEVSLLDEAGAAAAAPESVDPDTPPRTPDGERPWAMSPTNGTGTSFLVEAFAEEARAREEEEAAAAAAALAAAQEAKATRAREAKKMTPRPPSGAPTSARGAPPLCRERQRRAPRRPISSGGQRRRGAPCVDDKAAGVPSPAIAVQAGTPPQALQQPAARSAKVDDAEETQAEEPPKEPQMTRSPSPPKAAVPSWADTPPRAAALRSSDGGGWGRLAFLRPQETAASNDSPAGSRVFEAVSTAMQAQQTARDAPLSRSLLAAFAADVSDGEADEAEEEAAAAGASVSCREPPTAADTGDKAAQAPTTRRELGLVGAAKVKPERPALQRARVAEPPMPFGHAMRFSSEVSVTPLAVAHSPFRRRS